MSKLKRVALILAAITVAWGAIGLTVPFVGDADEVAVPYPQSLQMEMLPASVRILSYNDKIAVFASDTPNLAAKLYKAGAWIVLPASNGSCLNLSEPTKPARKRSGSESVGLSEG
ncbi:hypothetical protein PSE_1279 [Pseudovibrio sp. FO-BEG1]|uniref:hypothetical protein n=1 Tax=Pseudovibrio sp. (strain FO-BEG1) TaxID=911045 RepID=UPI000238D340|nr:hypothetical protein [Pseudovibrio sp. FO-BEG1]AEV35791.1 hypothetical protein PSE_1279 [Pseudovibrio sp. FO-BEG1]